MNVESIFKEKINIYMANQISLHFKPDIEIIIVEGNFSYTSAAKK